MTDQDDRETLPPPSTDPPPPRWAAKLFSELSTATAAFFAAANDMRLATVELRGALADHRALTKRIEALEAEAAE